MTATHASFIDGDGRRQYDDDAFPEWRDTLVDGLARHVSEEAAVFWDRDVADAAGFDVDEHLRFVRKLGTWRAFHNPPRSRFDAGADPNAFVAEWDPGAARWWTGLEQNSMRNAVEHVVDYSRPAPDGELPRDRPATILLARRHATTTSPGTWIILVSRVFFERLERDPSSSSGYAFVIAPDFDPEGVTPIEPVRRVRCTDYYVLDDTGARRARFWLRAINHIEKYPLVPGRGDEIEARIGAYANLITSAPSVSVEHAGPHVDGLPLVDDLDE